MSRGATTTKGVWLRLRVGPKLQYRGHVWHKDAGNGSTVCGLVIMDRRIVDGDKALPKCRSCLGVWEARNG